MSITFTSSSTSDALVGQVFTKSRRNSCVATEWTAFALIHSRRNKLRMPTQPCALTQTNKRNRTFARTLGTAGAFITSRRNSDFGVVFEIPQPSVGLCHTKRNTLTAQCVIAIPGVADVTSKRNRLTATTYSRFLIERSRRNLCFGIQRPPIQNPIILEQYGGYLLIEFRADTAYKILFDNIGFHAGSPSAQAVLALLDSIAFHGTVTQQVNLHALIAAQLAFGDVSFGAPAGILSDTVRFSDSNIALAMRLATLLDSFAVSAALTRSAAIFAFLSDAFEFDASLSVQQHILQALQDGFEFGMTLFTGADTYTAWVMTTQTRAMTSYSNYAFNSYAPFCRRLFAAKDDGVYVLEGATDAGQAINASVRSGLLDFGSRQLKRVERAYLGYTADGTLALRVTTTSPQGKKIAYTYRMVKTPSADAPRETRVIIGKGLQSVYWAFELDNSLDGGDFELHDVTVLPIILSRKVR